MKVPPFATNYGCCQIAPEDGLHVFPKHVVQCKIKRTRIVWLRKVVISLSIFHSVTHSHTDLLSWKLRNKKSYEFRSRMPVMCHVCKRDSKDRAMEIDKKLKIPLTGREGP
jgi:hypothetical protein